MIEFTDAWCAGILEGEGTFGCYKIKNRRDSYRAVVSMSMCDKDVLETFAKQIGVGRVKGPYFQENRKDRYTWEVQNFRDCLHVVERVLPFLHSRRREKAEELKRVCIERLNK